MWSLPALWGEVEIANIASRSNHNIGPIPTVREVPLKTSSSATIPRFLEENIITWFGVPSKITTDNAIIFHLVDLMTFCSQYNLSSAHSANYYPQGNGLAESSNKNLICIIRKVVGDNKRSWNDCLKFSLWVDRITKKHVIGKSPFELVYGLDVVLSVNLRLSV